MRYARHAGPGARWCIWPGRRSRYGCPIGSSAGLGATARAGASDPAKRASYDAQGSAALAGAAAEDLWGGIDFADIFGPGAAAFGTLFERLFGPAAAGPQRGDDVYLDLVIPLSIRTRADPRFTRSGADLWHDLHIQAPDAALGSLDITVIPDIPRQLSARQRRLYEQLRVEEAGIGSTADRSREPETPRSGRGLAVGPGGAARCRPARLRVGPAAGHRRR